MVMKELVQEVNAELRKLREEAKTQQDHPRLLRVIELLVRLTNVDGVQDDDSVDAQVEKKAQAIDRAEVASITEHVCFPNVYGECVGCGKCLHQKVDAAGTCAHCGEQVE